MKSRDTFAILHLSDLHIVTHSGDNYSTVLNRMLDHIEGVTLNVEKIIIVFTGDLVEKGEFEKAKGTIYKFFTDLKEKLGDKIIDIVCAPGNHDKKRGRLILGTDVKEGDEAFWQKFRTEEWPYFENQFSEYKETISHIQKEIFGVQPQTDSTYGVRFVEIEDGCTICFLCFNSAWTCIGGTDEGNLRIGKFQLDELMNEYQKNKKNVDLVIGLMHHPTDWLTKTEQKYLNQYMTDEYRLNTNIMLQGHIHEKETCNWYNQNHSLTTLVTGMGWDQQREINEGGHRYSLYRINMESCIVKVNTYVTEKDGKFKEDTAVYNGANIVFPLYVHRFLELNNLKFKQSEIPFFYPNYNSAESLEQVTDRINEFLLLTMEKVKDIQFDWIYYQSIVNTTRELSQEINLYDIKKRGKQLLQNYDEIKKLDRIINREKCIEEFGKSYYKKKNNLTEATSIINRIIESMQEDEDIDSYRYALDFLEKDKKIYLKNKWYTFIGEFCMLLGKKLFPKDELDEKNTVRIHFRILATSDTDIVYKKLFAYTITKENSVVKYMSEETELTDMPYENSMIQKSFDENKTMLFSLNPSSNKHKSKSDWIDFLTIAPNIECNKYCIEEEGEERYYPYISFGISVNSTAFQKTLRGITYINFDKILSRFLKKFCSVIPINFEDVMEKREMK